jgi:hypothetical protein
VLSTVAALDTPGLNRHDITMTLRKESEQCGLQVPVHKDYASNDSTTYCLCVDGPLALGNCAYFRGDFPEACIWHTTSPIRCRSVTVDAFCEHSDV